MRIVVTGGAGFIGSHVVDALLAEGHEVIVVDDLSAGSLANLPGDVEVVEHDIATPGTAARIAGLRADVIVHAAAQVSVSRSVADPADDARTNVVGSIEVFTGARDAGTPAVVYVTTGGALYGVPRYLPCDEAHPIEPISPYGLSKWVGERALGLITPGARRVVLRLANVYGPRQDPHGEAGVVSIFASQMLRDGPIEIHGDGRQTRDFVYVGDVAAAVERAVRSDDGMTVNIGSGTATSVLELFDVMRDLSGYELEPVHRPPRPGDVRDSVLDVRLAAASLGWTARVPLPDGLERTLAWARSAATAPRPAP